MGIAQAVPEVALEQEEPVVVLQAAAEKPAVVAQVREPLAFQKFGVS